jgi:cytidyltransferase-like protein
MPKLIAEGGVAGHLAHLYDNRGLTFSKIEDILTAATKGQLVGTEKTDGFNVYLGFKNGEARAARNKGDMQKGGMNAVDLAMREFKGGPEVKKVYVDAFNAFETAVMSLSDEQRQSIFGDDGEIFYNSEIMGPGASNVVNYDADIITIHGGGHKRYDEKTDKVVDADADQNSRYLDRVIDKFEEATQGKKFNVQRTAALTLNSIDKKEDLKIALAKIRKSGLDGDTTIEQYLDAKIREIADQELKNFNKQTIKQVVDRILKKPGSLSLTKIYKGMLAPQKEIIRDFVKNGNKLISKVIWPIEEAIHDFAVAMLEGLESAYVLDNAKELDRLKQEVETAIKSIQAYSGPEQELAHEILFKQLNKIKHLDNISTVVEGFVFEYDGQLYKFTGNFAPINQILGLFRFGRKGVKIPRVDEAKGVTETVAVIPGAFKPPHRGHLDMVKHYADKADRVIVMVSPKARQTPSGKDITQENSIDIWNYYFDVMKIDNVEVIPSPHPSPVRSAYEYVDGDAKPGELVILGTSTKGGDQSRFAKNVQQYAKEGVTVLDPMRFAFEPVGEELSATDFRAAIEKGDIDKFIPDGVNPENVLEKIGIQGETEEVAEHVALPIFFRLIEEVMNEMEPIQKAYAKGHARKRLSTKGKRIKSAPFNVNPPKARAKSAPPGFGSGISEGVKQGVWHHGTRGELEGDLDSLYLTPSKALADMLGDKVYSFKIKPNAKWLDIGTPEHDHLSMDTIGYMQKEIESLKSEGVDIVWDIDDFNGGFQQVYVVNPQVLETFEADIEEISSMGGGSVEGGSLPLGVQTRKKKRKKVYMEPHMHQGEGKIHEISTMGSGEPNVDGAFGPDYPTYKVDKKTDKNQYPYAGIKISIRKKKYKHDKEDIKFPRMRKDAHKYGEE